MENNKLMRIIIILCIIIILAIVIILVAVNNLKNDTNSNNENYILDNRYEVNAQNKRPVEKTSSLAEKNQYNGFSMQAVKEESLLTKYLEDYKENALKYPEEAYNSLNEEYRKNRFGSLEKYKQYVTYNKATIENIKLSKYAINNYNDYNEYICVDQYENYYIFKVKNVMNYTLKLDTYTIPSDKFKSEYNSGNAQKKVQLNIDKFIKMINNKDYSNIYDLLDKGFKNNYFKTEEEFEKFIKEKFFEYNNVTFDKFSNEGEIYIYEITLTDKSGKNTNGKKKLNIIMKLLDDYNFVISFGSTAQ